MFSFPKFVKLKSKFDNRILKDIWNIISLFSNHSSLILDVPVEDVIKGVSVDYSEYNGYSIEFVIDVNPKFYPLFVGKGYTNIQCLRKLASNASGKSSDVNKAIYYKISLVEDKRDVRKIERSRVYN